MTDFSQLPGALPAPTDDGAADHLLGSRLPSLRLAATDGSAVALDELGAGRTVLYFYPRTGEPGTSTPKGWDAIPGARGCTPEACGFRDHYSELVAAAASRVYGLSSQSTSYQAEVVQRLGLPFPLASDADLELADAMRLPTFDFEGDRLYARLTLVVRDGVVEHVFYPVFPPDTHAAEVLAWLQANPTS